MYFCSHWGPCHVGRISSQHGTFIIPIFSIPLAKWTEGFLSLEVIDTYLFVFIIKLIVKRDTLLGFQYLGLTSNKVQWFSDSVLQWGCVFSLRISSSRIFVQFVQSQWNCHVVYIDFLLRLWMNTGGVIMLSFQPSFSQFYTNQ